MVLACSYALNAHQAAHSAPSSSAESCHSNEERKCGNSAQGATKRCGSGYGRDLRSEGAAGSCGSAAQTPISVDALFATPQQKRLAEITEMIHTASLFHDDVIDKVCII
jgi:geranylgeranyl pyrophosphate synthase